MPDTLQVPVRLRMVRSNGAIVTRPHGNSTVLHSFRGRFSKNSWLFITSCHGKPRADGSTCEAVTRSGTSCVTKPRFQPMPEALPPSRRTTSSPTLYGEAASARLSSSARRRAAASRRAASLDDPSSAGDAQALPIGGFAHCRGALSRLAAGAAPGCFWWVLLKNASQRPQRVHGHY